MEYVKEYLSFEQARNRKHATLYERLLKRAFPGRDETVMVGHHIGFEFSGDIATENEIPSADCLLFDHDIMGACFGGHAQHMMISLAQMKPGEREDFVLQWLDSLEKVEGVNRSSHNTEVA